MRKIYFERQSGGAEDVECVEFHCGIGALEFYRHTLGKNNCGIPLLYVHYAVPMIDVRWYEEVIPADDKDPNV